MKKKTDDIRSIILSLTLLVIFFCAAEVSAQSKISGFESTRITSEAEENFPKLWNLSSGSMSSFKTAVNQNRVPVKFGTDEKLSIEIKDFEKILGSDYLQIPLPTGEILIARRDSSRDFSDTLWSGSLFSRQDAAANQNLEVTAAGNIIISIRENFIFGVLFTESAVYEFQGSRDDTVLSLHNSEADSKCLLDNEAEELTDIRTSNNLSGVQPTEFEIITSLETFQSRLENKDATTSNPTDSGDRIDVLVVYTTNFAAQFNGNSSQIEAFAETSIATANTVFSNSGNITRVNLVGTMQTNRTESGNLETDLNFLKGDQPISGRRNQVGADLVVMLVNEGNACGTASLLTKSGAFLGSGFSVVKRSCAVGGLAFAHEIGHSFGATHDPSDLPVPISALVSPGAFGYSVNGEFITIMGLFSNENCPVYCPRILNFSNPSILRNGVPTGVAGQRDNASVIELSADLVANLRVSNKTLTLTYPNNIVTWRRNMPRIIRWESSGISGNVRIEFSRNGGRSFETLIETTPNDGEEMITIKGRGSKNGKIRIISVDSIITTDTSRFNVVVL